MKFVKFTIKGYRAIEETSVSIRNNLSPIIGVNESGKTTILQAILAFDKNSDNYQGGTHLDFANRYDLSQTKEAVITAEITLETQDELETISKNLNLQQGDILRHALEEKFSKKETILLSRCFRSKERPYYFVDNVGIKGDPQNKKLAKILYEELPYILYFDDFSDRVPENIEFRLDNISPKGYSPAKIRKSEEWHKLVEEMFVKKGSSIEEYLKITDGSDKDGLISDIQDALNEDIIKDWKELISRYGTDFSEESANLELELKAKPDVGKIIFEFKVKDRTNRSGRFFNITERSKGFQWFFNFTIKLKYNHKYKKNRDGAIYLLDEPGSYLHTSAQEELLKKLNDISNTNTILYCTHSQFLLNPDVVNIAKIIIAKKESGKIQAIPFKSSGFSEEEGALAPLYKALHARIPYIQNVDTYQVITEGIVEYYFLKMLQKHTDCISSGVLIIPGSGATQLSTLISYAITFTKGYKVLLDSDKESRDAYDEYKKKFGDEVKNFFKYKLKTKQENVVFEEHFSSDDTKRLLEKTGTVNTKTAITTLYYSDDNTQAEFVRNLDTETKENFSIMLSIIHTMQLKSV